MKHATYSKNNNQQKTKTNIKYVIKMPNLESRSERHVLYHGNKVRKRI